MPNLIRKDRWDALAQQASELSRLVDVARSFLRGRQDQALGLVPAQILPEKAAKWWLLYWCAARRVDDSIERDGVEPREWQRRLGVPAGDTLAERCVEALLDSMDLSTIPILGVLRDSLRGMELEAQFTRPRGWREYEGLLELKSVPTMRFFDALVAPEETAKNRDGHARAFAFSAQVGDDCRDAFHDLARGRCFVTKDELGGHTEDPVAFVAEEEFARERAAKCRGFLTKAEDVARDFVSTDAKRRLTSLHDFWSQALHSGRIRPTDERLLSTIP